MSNKEIAHANTILRGVVGSTAHGTNIPGTDDRDEMGVFIEPPEYVCGLSSLDHYIQRDQPDGVRSQPGDLDLTLYSLRKFCRLAETGNPSVMILLWLPNHIVKTRLGERLCALRSAFRSKKSGMAFLGYLDSQRKRLTGELSKNVARPELVEKYGYDTKFAAHALRLGFEGIEFMRHGTITMPKVGEELATLRAIRTGEIKYDEALRLIVETQESLKASVDACNLSTNEEAINRFLVAAHQEHWATL